MILKKTLGLFLILITLISVFSYNITEAKEFDVEVNSAILIEAETGQMIYGKNVDKKVPPASITKIMTLLLAMEKVEQGDLQLDDEIPVSRHAESMGGSQIFLPHGINLKLEKLLEAVAIASANDASVAVAEAVAGSYSNFIRIMNEKTKELGMNNTHFVNSTGLPSEGDNHYSTARDISIMARELIKHEKVLDWTSRWVDYVQLPERKVMLVNTNKLVKSYNGLDGLKTGHTSEAGFCLSATAKKNNMRLISVILNAESEQKREDITSDLLNYGFNTFRKVKVVEKDKNVENIMVPSGKKTVTTGITECESNLVIKRGKEENINVETRIDEKIAAPIKKGDVIGKKVIMLSEKKVDEVNILATEDIKKANIFVRLWRSFVNWIGSWLQKL